MADTSGVKKRPATGDIPQGEPLVKLCRESYDVEEAETSAEIPTDICASWEDNENADIMDVDSGQWAYFPEHIITCILSYLPLKDRYPASLCCQNWHVAFHRPELWTRFTFWFYMPHQKRYLGCLDKHGQHLQSIYIELDQSVPNNRENACTLLKKLAEVRSRRLTSLHLRFMGENPYFYAGLEFVEALMLLFGPIEQNQVPPVSLTHVDLSGLNVMYDDKLFDLLSSNHPQLEKLNIQNRMLVCKVTPTCVLHLVMGCRRLTHLYIYSCSMSEDILLALTEPDREPLKHLALQCRREEKYVKDLRGATWAAVAKHLPGLRVTLGFDHTCPLVKVSEIMKPEVPVSVLKLETFTYIYSEVRQATRYYNKTLEKMIIQTPMSRNSPELNDALVELAEKCTNLSSLHVFCVLYKDTVEKILALHPEMEMNKTYTLRYTADPHPWTAGRDC